MYDSSTCPWTRSAEDYGSQTCDLICYSCETGLQSCRETQSLSEGVGGRARAATRKWVWAMITDEVQGVKNYETRAGNGVETFGPVNSKKAEDSSTKDPLAIELLNRIKMLIEAEKKLQKPRRDWIIEREPYRYGTRRKLRMAEAALGKPNGEERVHRGLKEVRRSVNALPCFLSLSGSKTWRLEGGTSR